MKPLGMIDFIPAIIPVDLQTAANAGDWISLKNCEGVVVIIYKAVGTAGDDPVINVEQALDVAGTTPIALNAITEIFTKQGTALTSVGTWTRTTQAADDNANGDATSAESQMLKVFSIAADQLDVDNGYDCMRVSIADVGGNAQLGCALYMTYGLRYPSRMDLLPSAIID